ncbi:isopenicillin N synthase family oxygenase [Streptomyces piniterrae]|uniref:Isopenicillin N synthase family oxygenase n=1 Tax=Streptomyces piniterrae TaxID=2571125 RepID=A0A4U0NRU6_9ACTN|nr:2-oxoglutarate and iron-dependent oxygenase domain-containing protein [Streptomyces piniterrae]TJZ57319.1 isopenicillin N synthase family oxygenase [Streptomyces piniterrae]
MSASRIPTIDLSLWRADRHSDRDQLATTVDQALQRSGFLLVTGHGIHPDLPDSLRTAARTFFHLPADAKEPFLGRTGGRGWSGAGAVAAGRAEGTETPPDLVETWTVGPNPTPNSNSNPSPSPSPSDTAAERLLPEAWPPQVPSLHSLVADYTRRMRVLADELLALLAAALGQPLDFFTRHTAHPDWTLTLNWYPPRQTIGAPKPGQFRVGPHTDFGTVTVLNRQSGKGGLQIHTEEGGWEDAPYDPEALTINIGDLMARWTGDRWRSGRHRVLPPPADATTEELTSLVYFYDCDPHTIIDSLPAPTGRVAYPPVTARAYVQSKVDKITLG